MDFSAALLDYPTTEGKGQHERRAMVRDRLYGEEPNQNESFRFHCETLFSRSSLYRFEIDTHQHPGFFQILYISEGDGDARLDGTSQVICPPAVILVPPGFEHGFRFSRDIAGVIVTLFAGRAVHLGSGGLAAPLPATLFAGDERQCGKNKPFRRPSSELLRNT